MDNTEQGYSFCECGKGVFLEEAGFDADMYFCDECECDVAPAKDFILERLYSE